jgi:hypothetical protein
MREIGPHESGAADNENGFSLKIALAHCQSVTVWRVSARSFRPQRI